MVNLRKKQELEEVSAASMSDIAFLLLVFFMVASVFYVKEGIASALPKKDSKPRIVLRENVYRITVAGDKIRMEHPSVGIQNYSDPEEFQEALKDLEVPDLKQKFALVTSSGNTSVQNMVKVLSIVRERGFVQISLKSDAKKRGGS